MTDSATPPPPRPQVSSAASVLATLVGFVALTTFCCIGIGTFSVRLGIERHAEMLRSDVEARRARRDQLLDAEALLEEIAQHVEAVRAVERMYPYALPEPPPPDPWGSDLAYERGGPDRAWLRSAGPDRQMGTTDDIVRALPVR